MQDETLAAAAKITPAAASAGAALWGYPLSDWVWGLSILYVCLQIALLLPKFWALIRRRSVPK